MISIVDKFGTVESERTWGPSRCRPSQSRNDIGKLSLRQPPKGEMGWKRLCSDYKRKGGQENQERREFNRRHAGINEWEDCCTLRPA